MLVTRPRESRDDRVTVGRIPLVTDETREVLQHRVEALWPNPSSVHEQRVFVGLTDWPLSGEPFAARPLLRLVGRCRPITRN
jgi:hypothetical protein